MTEITALDYLLLPGYLFLIYLIAFKVRNRFYPAGHALRPYFIPGLTVKLIGALLIGLIYAYYYKAGDTFDYFYHIKLVNGRLQEGVGVWWRVLTNRENLLSEAENLYSSQKFYTSTDTITVWQISSVISLFTFTYYLPTVLLISFISYTGTWQIFRFFVIKYPNYKKALAYSALFIPTTFIWGSGLFKDTFCQMAIGWMLIAAYKFKKTPKVSVIYLIIFMLGGWLLYRIKIYIFISFVPLLILYQSLELIKESQKKKAVIPIILVLTFLLYKNSNSIINYFIDETSQYSLMNIAQNAVRSKEYLITISNETDGSSFDLGEFEPTFTGLLSKFGPAVNATLFRPYIWESKKIIVFLSGIESLFALLFTSMVVIKLLLKRKLGLLLNNTILFCLSFSIIFAFMIGISTSNFGSLSRYKIPIEPFYFSMLIILYIQAGEKNKLLKNDKIK